jgi:hypothetical protein
MDPKKSIDKLLSDLRADKTSDPAPVSQGKSFEHLTDRGLLQLYEGIRHQVEADKAMGGRYRLVGNAAKQRAESLTAELVVRQLKFVPITWP